MLAGRRPDVHGNPCLEGFIMSNDIKMSWSMLEDLIQQPIIRWSVAIIGGILTILVFRLDKIKYKDLARVS